ncbi:MAG TPA: hypothetical protein VIM16_14785 [Mucilaginibacter sp.]|jgi:hypothetical protein
MKKTLLALFTIILSTHLSAQKIEVSIQANSGLFHYSGNGAASTSFINSAGSPQGYTNNPYGNKNGFSYGGDIQAQYVGKTGFIAGLQAGYEILRSKTDINAVYPYNVYYFTTGNYYNGPTPAKGQTFLQDQNININPYLGYRLPFKKIKIDIMPGMDFGININSYDKGSATASDGTVYRVNHKLQKAPTDVRLTLGVAAYYKKLGIIVGCAHGLVNYTSNLIGMTAGGGSSAPQIVHSELLRFGISYRVL